MQRLITIYAGHHHHRTGLTTDANKIRPGMPATILHPSDRYAAEVVSVSASGHQVVVRSACGEDVFTWRKGKGDVGHFAERGQTSPILALGFAETYLCPEL